MKQLILVLAVVMCVLVAKAQNHENLKKEGAHQSESNAKQNEVDGETGPSKVLYDAGDVSDATDDNQSDSSENTMTADEELFALDGTGNQASATLNVAGSPVPGSVKTVSEVKKAATRSMVSPSPVKESSTAKKATTSEKKGKKKKR
jgi:hypothetical protein